MLVELAAGQLPGERSDQPDDDHEWAALGEGASARASAETPNEALALAVDPRADFAFGAPSHRPSTRLIFGRCT